MSEKEFYIDLSNGIHKTYQDLSNDLSRLTSFESICNKKEFYDIFLSIIASIYLNESIVLVDADFSENEKSQLLHGVPNSSVKIKKKIKFNSTKQLLQKLENNTNWQLSIFTSGTTGQPKKITHNYKSLLSNIKISSKKNSNVWGFAYSPTHMAGIQVLFQALLNQNSLVRLFNISRSIIFESIGRYSITNISATPTFFKLMLPFEGDKYSSVEIVTFGGEKLPKNLKPALSELFPDAKFLNIYASSEAGALFAAKGDVFELNENLQEFVKVKDNCLFLHKSKLGQSNSIELIDDTWYNTNDLVEVIQEKPLQVKFLSRKNEMLNVGGYKVNPHEVEDAILKIPEVKDVKVFGKENSVLGQIICANIVLNTKDSINKKSLQTILKTSLQDFKVPRMIKFVEKIEITKTGKIKR